MEVLSLCPFRAGALVWQSAPNAWSVTVVVKATFSIVPGGEATLAPMQTPVTAFAADSEAAIEDLSPLKPRVDVLVLRKPEDDTATVELSSNVIAARGPIPPYAPSRRLLLADSALEWAAAVLRGEAAQAGPAPEGFDFNFFHTASREQRIDLVRMGAPIVLNNVLPGQARVETTLPTRKPQAFRIHPQTGKASEIVLRCDTLCIDVSRGTIVLTFRGLADFDPSSGMGTIAVAAHSGGKKIRGDRIERFLRNGEPIEGETHDALHPLEKRYDTVLAAPKGDTVALSEMDSAAGSWGAAPYNPSESSLIRALPFQPKSPDAPLMPPQPAPLNAPRGGVRLGTLAPGVDIHRAPELPFQGMAPPPPPDPHLPPPPPPGLFPPPPAMLPVAPAPEPPPPIQPPPMLGSSLAYDEKTADLPPGTEPATNVEDTTVDLPPRAAEAAPEPAAVPSLAEKTPNKPAKPAIAAPAAPKAATSPAAPKISAPAAPKALAPSAPKPAPAAPKPAPGKVAIRPPAPLGPQLKPGAAAPKPLGPSIAKKPDVAAKSPAVSPAKPAPNPVRPVATTVPFPGVIKPGLEAATSPAPVADDFDAASVMTVEQCAALDAELRHRAENRKTLLAKAKLTDDQWSAIQKYWAESISRETERGVRKLLLAYDAAYVAVQEKLGVPVGLSTHARLQIASERGTTATVLKELGLEATDQMRLGRVWTQKLADDPARMKELSAAIDAARAG